MVTREDEKYVLWPIYFDARATRPHRRVPRDLAVQDPSAKRIAEVARDLRLNPVLEKTASHPSRWWEQDGRVLVDIRGSKAVLLRQIAERLHTD